MSELRKVSGLLIAFVLAASTGAVTAQEVSTEELNKFGNIFQEMQTEGQKAEQEIMIIIQEKGLDIERFNEIQEAAMNPEKEVKASPEELQKHEVIMVEIQKMQPLLESKMKAIITDNGLTVERYQEVGQALQNSPELQQQFQNLMMKRQTQE